MTKAYLVGFIAGTMGKGWKDNPYKDSNFSRCALEWRFGCDDGNQVQNGDINVGLEQVSEE